MKNLFRPIYLLLVALALCGGLGIRTMVQAAQTPAAETAPKAKVKNPHGTLNTPCQNCHTYMSWKPIRSMPEFNHALTGYPLQGMHQQVPCMRCHTSLVFSKASKNCSDCHADIHRGQFGKNCEKCHTVKGWSVSIKQIQDHQNRFPLVGAHALLDCVACHTGAATGRFTGLSTACYSCHAKDYKTPVIDHVTASFPTTCQVCHSMDTWFGASFDHFKYTGYALTGMHSTLPCTACHANNVYKGTPTACYSCHTSDFNKTTNPPHVSAGFPKDCSVCHTTAGWSPATFNHSNTTFPLTGAHISVPCSTCHINNNYTTLPTTCIGCHTKDFNNTDSPPHVAANLPQNCLICHNTTTWLNASFDHTAYTNYPLTGMHKTVACTQCHVNNKYVGTPADCYACHKTDFTGTNNPPHVTSGFPTDCSVCHSTAGWSPASFNHNNTGFPLTGAHVSTPCTTCHVNNNYTTLPTTCSGCHLKDYNGTTNPNHAAGGFPTTCETCHSTSAWSPSTFNHNNTPFPLTGAHVTTPCTQCHINNVYAGTPTDCYSCHSAQYKSTTNPNHAAAGFPTTCQTCHNTTSWAGATFNHTWFDLNHHGANGVCTVCHTNANDYSVFTCTGCHTKTKTDGQHQGISGYVYNSVNCYACHGSDMGGGGNAVRKAAHSIHGRFGR